MNRIYRLIGTVIVISLALLLASCGAQKQYDDSADFVTPAISKINESNIKQLVFEHDGFALLLFFNNQYWESRDMYERFTFFAGKYKDEMRFCEYSWDVDNSGEGYGLELLPTVILYKNGTELDRIKGIPRDEKDRLRWNDDINLWLVKNVSGAKGDMHSGSYSYKFNNSSSLDISNY